MSRFQTYVFLHYCDSYQGDKFLYLLFVNIAHELMTILAQLRSLLAMKVI